MKYLTLKVVLPKWCRWVATDSNGRFMAYEVKPAIGEYNDVWLPCDSKQFKDICYTTPPRDWRKTLRKIK